MRKFEAEHAAAGGAAVKKPSAAAATAHHPPAATTRSRGGAGGPQPPAADDSKRTNILLAVVGLCIIIIAAIFFQSGSAKTASKQRSLSIIIEGLTLDVTQTASGLGLTPNLDLLGLQGASNSAPGMPPAVDTSTSQMGSLASVLAGAPDSTLPIIANAAAYAGIGPSVRGPWTSFLRTARAADKWVSVVGGAGMLSDGSSCGALDLECVSLTTFTRCDPATSSFGAKGVTNPSGIATCNANTRYWLAFNYTDNDVVSATLDAITKSEVVLVHFDSVATAINTAFCPILNNNSSPIRQQLAEPLDMQVINAVYLADSIIGRILVTIADRAAERFEDWIVTVTGTQPFHGAVPVASTSTAAFAAAAPSPQSALSSSTASPSSTIGAVYSGVTAYKRGTVTPVAPFTSVWSVLDVAPTVLNWFGLPVTSPGSIRTL